MTDSPLRSASAPAIAALLLSANLLTAADAVPPASGNPGCVARISVVSDKVPDVSTLAAWKKSFITDGMSNADKAKAVWKSVAAFQYQATGPVEYLCHEDSVYDPIKMFNVYGYGICSYAAAHVVSLGRYAGLQGRGWGINCHSVCELEYDGGFHLIDSSLITYFPKADGSIASVAEITAGVQDWYAKNPAYFDGKHGIDAELRKFERGDGRTAWKSKGPEILSRSPTFSAIGWFPAGTHGWYSPMQEYDGTGGGSDGKSFIYEYGALNGYEVNIQLRRGETLVRNWSNQGLHVNMDAQKEGPDCMSKDADFLRKAEAWMGAFDPKLKSRCNGRIGNGTLSYVVPLADGGFRDGSLLAENLATTAEDKAPPTLHAKDAATPGVLVLRMPSSYVYLRGTLSAAAVVAKEGKIVVELSDNNGLDWKSVSTIVASGSQELDLSPFVLRRYDYRLRFTLVGAGTGLDALSISHDIQNSQRALPALGQGDNVIDFNAGAQESTISIQANSMLKAHAGKQVEYTDFHPELVNMVPDRLKVKDDAREGSVTVPIATPGDMRRLRVAAHYRTWGDEDTWDIQASFDDGKTFVKVGDGPGQKFGRTVYHVYDKVPAGTRSALVRYVGKRATANMLWSFRIDADYQDPRIAFRPIKVTYAWTEDGVAKQDVHVAAKPTERYTITCAREPVMASIALAWAE
jgi:hypothetical protein